MKDLGELKIIYRAPDSLVADPHNSNTHPPEQIKELRRSIRENGIPKPILLKGDDKTIGAGNGLWEAAKAEGVKSIPTITIKGLSEQEWRRYAIQDNRIARNSVFDMEILKSELTAIQGFGFDIGGMGFAGSELAGLGFAGFGEVPQEQAKPLTVRLSDKFGIAPFSVFNAREGWWQERKRAWLALGIKSEVGRGENLLKMSDTILQPDPAKRAAGKGKARTFGQDLMKGEHVVGQGKTKGKPNLGGLLQGAHIHKFDGQDGGAASGAGTSIFDPVLCELAYRWFSPAKGVILDPFAGGSVRGIVAAKLGRQYVGVDLRPEQVEANAAQAKEICKKGLKPKWIVGDSRNIAKLAKGVKADFIFSCPPYAALERYSDDHADISTLEYAEFRKAYLQIVKAAVAMLKPDRFACFVVGDVRGKDGNYYGFVPDTIRAFEEVGARLYNEAILVTAAGSLPIRAGKQFESGRKLGKTHQNVLVFLKGSAKKAVAALGKVEFGDIDEGPAPAAPENPAPSAKKKAQKGEGRKYGEEL